MLERDGKSFIIHKVYSPDLNWGSINKGNIYIGREIPSMSLPYPEESEEVTRAD